MNPQQLAAMFGMTYRIGGTVSKKRFDKEKNSYSINLDGWKHQTYLRLKAEDYAKVDEGMHVIVLAEVAEFQGEKKVGEVISIQQYQQQPQKAAA